MKARDERAVENGKGSPDITLNATYDLNNKFVPGTIFQYIYRKN